jgi:predicted PurR-regulated permease PerM
MSTADNPILPTAPGRLSWPLLLKRLAIWGAFLGIVYLARDFFFVAFMTFMISYLALALVQWGMGRLSPNWDTPGVRRLMTVGVFVFIPLALLATGALVIPRLIAQGQRLAGWLSQASPESEVSHLLEGYVGPSEFRRQFGGPDDPRYQKAFTEFRQTGAAHVAAYLDFPKLESWVEGGFNRQFVDAERGRIRSRLMAEGTSSKDFEAWYRARKFPALKAQDPSADPDRSLAQARRDPAALAALQQEWLDDAVAGGLTAAKQSPAYHDQFHEYYDEQRAGAPATVPYTFDQFIELQAVRPKGPEAFGATLEKIAPTPDADRADRARADFETAKTHELFQTWWGASPSAQFIRHQVESGVSGAGTARIEHVLSSLLNVPVDLGTAMLLSFFICIDFPALRRASGRLRDTWLRDAYDEMAPALSNLGVLVGRAMQAQGLIAFCNATILFLAMTVLGVEHAALLAGAVFLLCLVPTLGTIIAWVLLAGVALVQPGGGVGLALKVSAAVVLVVVLETFVFSPRILGRMMELHPVLIIAVLPLAQYFFGVWGLILATPVTVYVIHVVILQRGLPGIDAPTPEQRQAGGERPAESDKHSAALVPTAP